MIRAAVIAFLASPAYAATVPAIQIEECVAISAKDMARDGVERVDVCEWPGPVDLPPLDIASLDPLATKDVSPFAEGGAYGESAQISAPDHVNPPSPGNDARAVLPVAPFLSWSRNVQAATGGASALASAYAGASSFSSSEARCGCVTEPEPSPVPLPAGLWFLVGALGLLWRRG